MPRQTQINRTRTAHRDDQVEDVTTDSGTTQISDEEIDCCLEDIDETIREGCCLIEESAEHVPTPEEFTTERNRLRKIYWAAPEGTEAEAEAEAAVEAWEDRWPQYGHLCTC